MNITTVDLRRQRDRLNNRDHQALRDAVIDAPHVDLALILAIASRESGMRNIVGDGGHGRGFFQQDDRYQQAFLRAVRGCKPGTNTAVFPTALPKGRVPTIAAGARRCVAMLEQNVTEAKRLGIPDGERTRFALAAYNAGVGGALSGWQSDRNPDKHTAGGDYGEDVLARARALR